MWQRLKRKDPLKATDRLYVEYNKDKFEGIVVDQNEEPELYKFIESSKVRARFNNYTSEKLEHFAQRIYELRKD